MFTVSWKINTSELGRMWSRREGNGGVIMLEGVSHEKGK